MMCTLLFVLYILMLVIYSSAGLLLIVFLHCSIKTNSVDNIFHYKKVRNNFTNLKNERTESITTAYYENY